MLPSRSKLLAGINYTPPDKKEYEEMQEEQKRKLDEKVDVEPWGMVGGRFTQLLIKYRGEKAVLCISDEAPNDLEALVNAVKNFYNYIDLEKTGLLKKASSNDKVSMSTTVQKRHRSYAPMDGSPTKADEDRGLTVISNDYKFPIIKERLIQIFAYVKKRLTDESIPEYQREIFDTDDIHYKVYNEIYKNAKSQNTVRNRVLAALKYLTDNGYIEYLGKGARSPRRYRVLHNPFESEMPAQAEPIDTDYLKESKAKALQLYREQ